MVDVSLHAGNSSQKLLNAFCRKILSLNWNDNPIRSSQCVDRQHSKRRATIQQNVIISLAEISEHLLERGFPAHSVDEGHLHSRQSDVRRKNIHAFFVVKDTLTGRNRLIIQYLAHELCQRHWQGIRLRMSQTDGRTALGITISNEHLLSFTGEINAQVDATGRFTGTALLVDNSDNAYGHDQTSFRWASLNR